MPSGIDVNGAAAGDGGVAGALGPVPYPEAFFRVTEDDYRQACQRMQIRPLLPATISSKI